MKKNLQILAIIGISAIGCFFGTNTFAAAGTASCSKTQAANSSSVWEGHGYTCQNNTATLSACGTTSNKQSCQKPAAGDTCSLYCCICTQEVALTAADCLKDGKILSASACVACAEGKETKDGTTCIDKMSGGGITCKAPLIPNAAQTECVNPPANPATPTETACAVGAEINNCTCDREGVKKQDGKCVSCDDPGVCCGVELNTNVPRVGKCIKMGTSAGNSDTTVVTEADAFPKLMGGLTKILTTIILLLSFGAILAGGVMVAASGGDSKRAGEGKALIGKVIIALAVLGASGIILHLINPNFF